MPDAEAVAEVLPGPARAAPSAELPVGGGLLRPRLRPVQASFARRPEGPVAVLRDRTGLVEGAVVLPAAMLLVAECFDGRLTTAEVAAEFRRRHGVSVPEPVVVELAARLDEVGLLDGPGYRELLARQDRAWAASPHRPPLTLLAGDDWPTNRRVLAATLEAAPPVGSDRFRSDDGEAPTGRLFGLVAPHLDYLRGAPCYGRAYRTARRRLADLATETGPEVRFVILGTNHAGRHFDRTIACDKDFRTPLGTARTDMAFVRRLSDRLGTDLTTGAVDHGREHSIELQVRMLQHLFGASVRVAGVLCPDPCGPTGTRPLRGEGADLGEFADALADLVDADEAEGDGQAVRTVLVASADLAHVGTEFGDPEPAGRERLTEVAGRDGELLSAIDRGDPDGMVAHLRTDDNARRVCSAGCLYVLTRAAVRAGARPRVTGYHQATDGGEGHCVVSCASAEAIFSS